MDKVVANGKIEFPDKIEHLGAVKQGELNLKGKGSPALFYQYAVYDQPLSISHLKVRGIAHCIRASPGKENLLHLFIL